MKLEHFHQPIIFAGSRELCGAELLSRYDGKYSPEAVLGQNAIKWLTLDLSNLAHLRDGGVIGSGFQRIFVNLAPVMLRHTWALDAFLHACRQTTDRAWVDITVEVSENVSLNDKDMIELAGKIRLMGMKSALDNYSGTRSCYKKAALGCWDAIKISSRNWPIERTCDDIIKLSHLDVTIIASAIESEKDMIAVEAAGANLLQGWHSGKPMPVWTCDTQEADPSCFTSTR